MDLVLQRAVLFSTIFYTGIWMVVVWLLAQEFGAWTVTELMAPAGAGS